MSFQSGKTLEHAGYGGSGPHHSTIIMIASDKQEIRGEGGRVVEETNYAGQAVDLALDGKLCITKKMVRWAGSGKGQMGIHRGALERTGDEGEDCRSWRKLSCDNMTM